MKPLITIGNKTDHGGVVTEVNNTFLIEGKAVHLEGMKHFCPRCKTVVSAISLGQGFLTVNGKTIIMAGDKTTCGATFLPQQNLVARTGGSGGGGSSNSTTNSLLNSVAQKPFDEKVVADFDFAEGLPYFIETKSGKTYKGVIGSNGELPRISTENSEEYALYLGEEAILKGAENDS